MAKTIKMTQEQLDALLAQARSGAAPKPQRVVKFVKYVEGSDKAVPSTVEAFVGAVATGVNAATEYVHPPTSKRGVSAASLRSLPQAIRIALAALA